MNFIRKMCLKITLFIKITTTAHRSQWVNSLIITIIWVIDVMSCGPVYHSEVKRRNSLVSQYHNLSIIQSAWCFLTATWHSEGKFLSVPVRCESGDTVTRPSQTLSKSRRCKKNFIPHSPGVSKGLLLSCDHIKQLFLIMVPREDFTVGIVSNLYVEQVHLFILWIQSLKTCTLECINSLM